MLWFIKIFELFESQTNKIRKSSRTGHGFRFLLRHSSTEVKIHSNTWPKVFRPLRFIHALLNPTTTTFHSRLYLTGNLRNATSIFLHPTKLRAGKFNFDVKVKLSRFDGGTFVSVYLRFLLSAFPLLHYLPFLLYQFLSKKLFPFILIHEVNKYSKIRNNALDSSYKIFLTLRYTLDLECNI